MSPIALGRTRNSLPVPFARVRPTGGPPTGILANWRTVQGLTASGRGISLFTFLSSLGKQLDKNCMHVNAGLAGTSPFYYGTHPKQAGIQSMLESSSRQDGEAVLRQMTAESRNA